MRSMSPPCVDSSSAPRTTRSRWIGTAMETMVSPRPLTRTMDSVPPVSASATSGNALPLPAPGGASDRTLLQRTWDDVRRRFSTARPSAYDDIGAGNGKAFPEVALALTGGTESIVRVNGRGETIVSIAVPIQRLRVVRGALLLSTQGGDIDRIIASERWAILRVFLVSMGVMFLLSLLLAGTIAGPVRRLAEAAEQVRRGIKSRQEIPDFTRRSDEIGHLSGALRDMTRALYHRLDAIESFAADVAHELKNPLTSLRSAVETFPRVRTDEARGRLLAVIQHDVRRLDRLISDISDASRLDAELSRGDVAGVDLAKLLGAVVSMAQQVKDGDMVKIRLSVPARGGGGGPPLVQGHDSRIAQVFTNLLDNARSFTAPGGEVRVTLKSARGPGEGAGYAVIVDDDGPGIPAHAFERIFERFYTDRPTQNFSQNSGLGLSISRQIVEAHGGVIEAVNRIVPDPAAPEGQRTAGARFTVWLPASV